MGGDFNFRKDGRWMDGSMAAHLHEGWEVAAVEARDSRDAPAAVLVQMPESLRRAHAVSVLEVHSCSDPPGKRFWRQEKK